VSRRSHSVVTEADSGERLDTFLSKATGISRNRVQSLIERGLVKVDGAPVKKNHLLCEDETVEWKIPDAEPEDMTPQELPLDVLLEDDDIIVIDKPAGMVMYPGPGHSENTLANALLARHPTIAGVGGRGRPGVFHRLDRDTSGLVAVALSQRAYDAMVEELKERRMERVYHALLVGDIAAEVGTIDAPMGRSPRDRKKMAVTPGGGLRAVTHFKVLERFDREYTLAEVTLDTGRTHQIRVHFAYIGYPVAGDPDYSRGKSARRLDLQRQFLHATRLTFDHPVSGERMSFSSPLPEDLTEVLEGLRRIRGR
jgi:23S rRNA pseudouridine1911/1915/1917 synthase